MSETNENHLGDKPRNITWQELKDFVNGIEDQYLNENVLVNYSDEGYCKRLNEPFRLEYDVYYNIEDPEDCGTIEEIKMNLESQDEVFVEENYKLATAKNHPFLWID